MSSDSSSSETVVFSSMEGSGYTRTESEGVTTTSEGETLLTSERQEEKAGFLSSVGNLTNTIIGAGVLGLPLAISTCGLVLGGFFMLAGAVCSLLGLHFLALCGEKVNEKGVSSYFIVASKVLPAAKVAIDLAIAIKSFGVAVSYLIVIGQLMPIAMQHFQLNEQNPLLQRSFWIPVMMIVTVPLSMLSRMDSLKFASFVAIASVGYVWVLIIYNFSTSGAEDVRVRGVVYFASLDANFFSNLPIFVFAFTCHQNALTIWSELKGDTRTTSKVYTLSIVLALWIYAFIGYCGYLTYGSDVKDNIIVNLPQGVPALIARLAITILVTLSYPLQIHPARICISNIMRIFTSKIDGTVGYYVITFLLCGISFLIAFFLSDLGIVFSIIGATGSTLASFILPGTLYYFVERDTPIRKEPRKLVAILLAVAGVVLMVNSLFWISYKAANPTTKIVEQQL